MYEAFGKWARGRDYESLKILRKNFYEIKNHKNNNDYKNEEQKNRRKKLQ